MPGGRRKKIQRFSLAQLQQVDITHTQKKTLFQIKKLKGNDIQMENQILLQTISATVNNCENLNMTG